MRTKSPGEQALVLRGDEDNYGQSALVHLAARPDAAVVGEHLHPQFTERFWIISGRLGTRIVGGERTPGDRQGLEWPAQRVPSSVSEESRV